MKRLCLLRHVDCNLLSGENNTRQAEGVVRADRQDLSVRCYNPKMTRQTINSFSKCLIHFKDNNKSYGAFKWVSISKFRSDQLMGGQVSRKFRCFEKIQCQQFFSYNLLNLTLSPQF
jgi:hypothetical protein